MSYWTYATCLPASKPQPSSQFWKKQVPQVLTFTDPSPPSSLGSPESVTLFTHLWCPCWPMLDTLNCKMVKAKTSCWMNLMPRNLIENLGPTSPKMTRQPEVEQMIQSHDWFILFPLLDIFLSLSCWQIKKKKIEQNVSVTTAYVPNHPSVSVMYFLFLFTWLQLHLTTFWSVSYLTTNTSFGREWQTPLTYALSHS